MSLYPTELSMPQDEFRRADPESGIPDATKGYICVTCSSLSQSEKYRVIGLAGSSLKLSAIRAHFMRPAPEQGATVATETEREDRAEVIYDGNRYAMVTEAGGQDEHQEADDEDETWAAVAKEAEASEDMADGECNDRLL
ncbi:unnamed protein product [Prorocentrum cordatum]|uniref:Uncharacterized protein n=1 Tax=Prorocentrum cordatum TaxID=2364126 RepID=A0ABN9SFN0_9DINO|nr:unnamed protein product [Polarella glacialis]